MSYRPSSHAPETAWARHLDQIRRDRDWSATQMFEAVRVPLGLAEKSRSAFTGNLHKDPKAAYIPVLVKMFGAPPDEAPVADESAPDLATALLALTQELAAWRQEREDLQARVADLEELVALRAGSSLPGGGPSERRGLDFPRETAG